MTKDTVQEQVEKVVDDYFTTSPNYRGKNAMKILLTDALTQAEQRGAERERGEREKWLEFYREDIINGFKPKCSRCDRLATEQTAKGKTAQENLARPVNWGYYCKKCAEEGLKIENEAMYG